MRFTCALFASVAVTTNALTLKNFGGFNDGSIGQSLHRAFKGYVEQPITVVEALQMNFQKAQPAAVDDFGEANCDPLMGIPYTVHENDRHSPYILYFTARGELSGFGTHVYKSVEPNLLDLGYYTKLSENEYRIQIATRAPEDSQGRSLCDADAIYETKLGDRLIIQPHGINRPIPIKEEGAVKDNYRKGACFNGMGWHYFQDITTNDDSMSWTSAGLMPVVPMYWEGEINAVFFASSTVQSELSVLPPKVLPNGWEPIPLPNLLMCANACDAECTFRGTLAYSTMHFYFKGYKGITCPAETYCLSPKGGACCSRPVHGIFHPLPNSEKPMKGYPQE